MRTAPHAASSSLTAGACALLMTEAVGTGDLPRQLGQSGRGGGFHVSHRATAGESRPSRTSPFSCECHRPDGGA